jgi:hypothetical protein
MSRSSRQTETITIYSAGAGHRYKSRDDRRRGKVDTFIDQLPVRQKTCGDVDARARSRKRWWHRRRTTHPGSSASAPIVDGVNIASTGCQAASARPNRCSGRLARDYVRFPRGSGENPAGSTSSAVRRRADHRTVVAQRRTGSGAVAMYVVAPINQFRQASLFVSAVNQDKGVPATPPTTWVYHRRSDGEGQALLLPRLQPATTRDVFDHPVCIRLRTTSATEFRARAIQSYRRIPAAVAGIQTQKRTSNNYARNSQYATQTTDSSCRRSAAPVGQPVISQNPAVLALDQRFSGR